MNNRENNTENLRFIFVNTIESSLGKNHEIIKELPIPKKIVSPWIND